MDKYHAPDELRTRIPMIKIQLKKSVGQPLIEDNIINKLIKNDT